MSKKKQSSNGSEYDCPGFMLTTFVTSECSMKKNVIVKDGPVWRSAECVMRFRKRGQRTMCCHCKSAKMAKLKEIKALRKKGLLCGGIKRSRFEDLIKVRKWENERHKFSLVRFAGDVLFSTKCHGEKAKKYIRCEECHRMQDSLRALHCRLRKKGYSEERRILFSSTRHLLPTEQTAKSDLIRKRRANVLKKLRHAATKTTRLQKELKMYRPKWKRNRGAARSVVAHLDAETTKVSDRRCRWSDCRYEAESCGELLKHLSSVHVDVQHNENAQVEPMKRRYICCWISCERKKPFQKRFLLYQHLKEHSGTKDREMKLAMLRQQLLNAGRRPNGCRYDPVTKSMALKFYRSRKSWEKARSFCPLTMPSGRLVRNLKNVGGVESGVDRAVIKLMRDISTDRAYLRHGILVFDEIYIRATLTFHSTSKLLYGLADDRPGELAKTMLVFQYICLFSRRRFRANVGWYGCDALNKDNMVRFFFEVGTALAADGFHLHGVLCDGAACNRGLYAALKDRFGDNQTCTDSGVRNPFAPATGRFFLMSDPSHILKKLRNAWSMSFGPSMQRHMVIGVPQSMSDHDFPIVRPIKWQHLIHVYEWQMEQQRLCLRVDRPLTQVHVYMKTSFEKMIVRTAVDIISEPIHAVMAMQPDAEGTRYFMSIVRTFWLAMNNRRTFFDGPSTETFRNDLLSVAEAFERWSKDTSSGRHEYLKAVASIFQWAPLDAKTRMIDQNGSKRLFITGECFADLLAACRGASALTEKIFTTAFPDCRPQITPKLLTQDFLEKDFGEIRQRSAGSCNPTMETTAYLIRSMNMARLHKFKNNIS